MYLLYIFLVIIPQVLSQGCNLSISALDAPFIVDEDGKFSFQTYFEEEESFFLMCPAGTYNKFIVPGRKYSCVNDNLIVDLRTTEVLDFNILSCIFLGGVRIENTKKTCEYNSTIFEIEIGTPSPIASCCFNEDKLLVIYCRYLEDSYVNRSILASLCTPNNYQDCDIFLDLDNSYSGIDLFDVYRNQLETFKNLGVDVDITRAFYYLPGSLLDPYVFGLERLSYHARDYTNVVPFKVANLEETRYLYLSFSNIIGTLGQASTVNVNGALVQLSLNNGTMPIPQWIWGWHLESQLIVFIYNGIEDIDYVYEDDYDMDTVCTEYESCTFIVYKVFGCYKCSLDSVRDDQLKNLLENSKMQG